ncbi:MAG: hypothetical protein KF898_04700 [Parachlamydiales bacterium]|nr:hypothetical protein [Candidatus Acheromyda pituitae]
MSVQSISKSTFSLTPLHESAYALNIAFSGKDGSLLSTKAFTFIQDPSAKEGEIFDIFSQNGVCNKPLFTMNDVKGLKLAAAKLQLEKPQHPTVLVLDLKDSQKEYLDGAEIAQHEAVVCDFFQTGKTDPCLSRHAQKITPLFQGAYPLDFVLCEGSLKKDLVHQFSDAQAQFFLSGSEGPISFCQCAEYFMNGFKFGHAVTGISADHYIKPITNKVFHPFEKSTVWYPALYKEIYSPEGEFANTLKPIFSIFGLFDAKTKITQMSVELPL